MCGSLPLRMQCLCHPVSGISYPGTRVFMTPTAPGSPGFSQPCSQFKRPPAVLRENGPAPLLPLLRVEIVEYDLIVVLELERLEREEGFGVPERTVKDAFIQSSMDSVVIILHLLFRYVHRVDERSPYLLHKEGRHGICVGKVREEEPLHKTPHLPGHGSEIDRRAEDERIGTGYLFKNRSQSILHGAFPVALPVFQLTGKAARAAV